jgi:hypothetical protein
MKHIAIVGVAVILILTSLGAYWMRTSGNNGPEGGADNSSLKTNSIRTLTFSGSGTELNLNGKKTKFDFPGTDVKDVEVRLGNSFTFRDGHPDATFPVTIWAERPPVLTIGAYEKIQTGMTYPQIGEALGGIMTKGRISDGFTSRLELIQGKRRIYLTFVDGKVTEKSAKDLE